MRMKHMNRLALAASALLLSFAAAAQDPIPLRLIGLNDFHGYLEPPSLQLFVADPTAANAPNLRLNVGGAAALAGLVKTLRAGAPNSLVLGGGDLIGGSPLVSTLFKHESTIEVLNDLGLDVSALGNHEFDAGAKELLRIIKGGCAPAKPDDIVASCLAGPYQGARFDYIAANVVDAKGKRLVAPYVIKRIQGIPVGIIGAVTQTTPQMVVPAGIRGLRFLDEAAATNQAAKELRAKGVRAMIAVYHEGLELGSFQKRGDWNDVTCPEAHGPLLHIARRLAPEIKVIFSGHTHQGYRCEVDGRLLIQGTSYGRAVSVVDVELDPRTRRMLPVVRSYNLPVFNERTDAAHREKLSAATPEPFATALRESKPDAGIAEKVARYLALAAPKADRPVGKIGGAFDRSGKADSSAGRLIADAQLAATREFGAQFAFMNPGGIRSNLDCAAPPCALTFGQAFTMQPFGNSLVVMTLTGAQVKKMLEEQHPRTTGDPRFLSPSEGFTYTWQSDAPIGQRVRDMALNGQPIAPDKKYRVAVSNFLAEGGDGFETLKAGTERKGGGQDIDALLAYINSGDRVPSEKPRITRLP